MALTYDELVGLIEKGKQLGVHEIKAPGVFIKFADDKTVVSAKSIQPVPEVKAEEIITPMSVLDDLSPEEVLYYATPYYDQLQAEKELRTQQLKEKENG